MPCVAAMAAGGCYVARDAARFRRDAEKMLFRRYEDDRHRRRPRRHGGRGVDVVALRRDDRERPARSGGNIADTVDGACSAVSKRHMA